MVPLQHESGLTAFGDDPARLRRAAGGRLSLDVLGAAFRGVARLL
jgi:hypothetical protein